ncbi:3-deoxy-manno-octulosonate-8-phosphatase KdsC [Candidatus Venteria ishoeyi]|uniref:3-deoxy-D-manno-octulosonate 8-phosphate phosphatase KdsC n=1 Tax=Candidatus Venteria ishoeyi TaxID=1899563 RepID=A0A1H6FBH1_9GAMM|nr:3-deoxy-manno-octulosonate-8-phosphatase KdsC [Candidatus Venteria ishoeyi]MDM8544876.1 3-deoxy-manno-octulosonate-8-phosphatase KdsC [Candidatus Venteria ishoeyi]SEH07450.1 3-deoxy-D-manno-octulosonate 8-phosphate phosphatase KdsC [Candidatus Venteria ishoeyi]SEH08213.1 3-deoxy-D-manno-octulosonate 8-phosphate phosphatase KdsC [Candidatus Venteria ishoeyi]
MREILEKAAQIRLVLFDVDGVLTDGTLFVGDNGEEYKAFYARDGLGMVMLQRSGIDVGIITARTSNVVKFRMESLKIKYVRQGQIEKLPAFEQICQEAGLAAEQVAYVGDDVIDLPVMQKVGLAIAVADAHPLVLGQAHWVTEKNGGHGAARDVCELIMQAQKTWDAQVQQFMPVHH